MSFFAGLISSNIVHLVGILIYGIILILLTALGYKVISSIVGFKAGQATAEVHRLMGIITLGLILGFSLIIAVNCYESSPDIIFSSDAEVSRTTGGCGSKCAKKPKTTSGAPDSSPGPAS